MERFLIVYRGAPAGEGEDAVHHPEQWSAWFDGLGAALLDRGSLTQASVEVPSRLIGPKLSGSSLSGYSIVEAADFDEIVRLAQECPIFDVRGSVEIARLIDRPA
jgi:hypothetical protein